MPKPPIEIAEASPPTLDHFLGQRQVVEQLRVALAAYWADRAAGRPVAFGGILMSGPPGVGKTTIARILAAELGGTLKETLGQALGLFEDIYAVLLEANDDTVLFVDEAHLLCPHAQTTLFRAVEERKLLVPRSMLSNKFTTVPLSRFTLALATTDPQGILAPLRERMSLVLQFSYYSVDELTELCRQRANALQWEAEPEVFLEIARRSKQVPRLALRLLQSCRRTTRAENQDRITVQHFHRTLLLEGLHPELGLDKAEQAYLRALAETDGKARLSLLASRLGLPARNLSQVTEAFLLREGLITRSDVGRSLTDKGWEFVRRHLQPNT